MANEPDEVRSKDQPDAAQPAEKTGVSPSAPPPKPGLPGGEGLSSPGEPDLPPDSATDGPSTGEGLPPEVSGGESETAPSETEQAAAQPSPPDSSGLTQEGGAPDDFHAGETPDPYHDYHQEEMCGQSPVTEGSEGGQTDEYGYASEGDYYHHSEDTTGSRSTETAAPPKDETKTESESEESPFEVDENGEEYGGPVKSFLEHLEDFRWVIIKSLAAVLVAMVVCLVATPTVIDFLKWPLVHPLGTSDGTNQVMRLHFGTNTWEVPLATNQLGPLNVGTNRLVDWDLVPMVQGTNFVLALQPTPESAKTARQRKVPDLVVLDPVEPFTIVIQLAIYGGLGMASPFVMFFVGQFLVPALKKKERKYLYYGVGIGAGLFMAGVAFCYFVLLRVAIYATVQFANWMGFSSDFWRGAGFLSFTVKFMVGMGLAFELPVVLLTLVKIGILDHHKLSKLRPYWVILNLVLSGFITPSGDPFSMILMAAPIHILYEISWLIARYWAWRDAKRESAAAAETGQGD